MLRGENALATAEASALQLRGAAAAAEEARALAEARRSDAVAEAHRLAEELGKARTEGDRLCAAVASASDAERSWLEERNELRAALLEMAERREADLRQVACAPRGSGLPTGLGRASHAFPRLLAPRPPACPTLPSDLFPRPL